MSQLKPVVGNFTQVSPDIPDLESTFQFPVAVLDTHLCNRVGRVVSQLLVHWHGWPKSMETWEDEQVIKQESPGAPAWG